MGRFCANCQQWCDPSDFSKNQWRKGDGASRCKDCVTGRCYYRCSVCQRCFATQNELSMHQQVHRPRNVPCPVCGERRFKTGANAVQHVESGYCTGCRGVSNARQQIYDFARTKRQMRPYINDVPLISYDDGSYHHVATVPDFPYQCPQCFISFRNLSELMQHQDHKHNNHRMLTQY